MKIGTKQLVLQTASLIAGFMVWVMISSLMPYIQLDIPMTTTQSAWAMAIPVLLGSLLRIPIGYWTNRYGARMLFSISFALLTIPIFIISYAHSLLFLLIGGILLGVGGAMFSIGVTSLPKYHPSHRHGFINGIYGAGNIGTAFTAFSAPLLASLYGWRGATKIFLIIVIIMAIVNMIFGDKKEERIEVPMLQQVKEIYANSKLWLLCFFYFITFGSFIAFTIYLPTFLVGHFDLDKMDAGFRTAGFIAMATLLRPVGGWISDKINPFFVLLVVFSGLTIAAFILAFTPSLPIYSFGCLLVSICSGLGNGTVFKLVPMYFSKQAGLVNGIVSAVGGLGGFFPPLVLTVLFNLTGHYAIGFMALSEFSLASLILVAWLYFRDKHSIAESIVQHSERGIIVTDKNGLIQKINPAFTKITGFSLDEVIGKTPSVLQSGEHDNIFYEQMWKTLQQTGSWQGEVWNKRKNDQTFLEWLTITAVKNESGEIKNYVGIFNELEQHDGNNS